MQDLVETLSILLAERQWKVAAAESCTGGLLAAAITHRPGSSSVFDRGFVTYSNEAKVEMLDVSKSTLDEHGAVSSQVAQEMAAGALKNSDANLSISITGIAGPDGGDDTKPVGLVYLGFATKNGQSGSIQNNFKGTREQIRSASAQAALKQLISLIENKTP